MTCSGTNAEIASIVSSAGQLPQEGCFVDVELVHKSDFGEFPRHITLFGAGLGAASLACRRSRLGAVFHGKHGHDDLQIGAVFFGEGRRDTSASRALPTV